MEHILFLFTIFLSFAFSSRCNDVYTYSKKDFPEEFVFGSGVSAYQWEGAADEDGRKASIWDTLFHSRGGPTGDVACDGYHKYKEDVRLMYDMGLDAFRLSISWSRLIPSGRGPVNPKGVRFYKNLLDELKSHGIEPHVTLYHDDLPQTLEDEYGGWFDRKIIDDFTAFADVCFREFGNTVKFWSTINEPNMLAFGGSGLGIMHTTLQSNSYRANSSINRYIALHNMLLTHASTASLYKKKYKDKQNGFVGITCFTYWMVPFTSSKEDEMATQRAKDFFLGSVLHPLVFGDYPGSVKRIVGKRLPIFSKEESDLVKNSSDFVGVIHYSVMYTAHLTSSTDQDFVSDMNASLIPVGNCTLVKYDVLPWGLEGVLAYIKENYGNPPVYILENGRPSNHYSSSLNDVGRVEYLHAYIAALLNSVRNGSDTRGYFQWSFMDLFEFIDPNYTYGLYYVNFSDPELKRSPKTSAVWYSAFLSGTTFSSHELKNYGSFSVM